MQYNLKSCLHSSGDNTCFSSAYQRSDFWLQVRQRICDTKVTLTKCHRLKCRLNRLNIIFNTLGTITVYTTFHSSVTIIYKCSQSLLTKFHYNKAFKGGFLLFHNNYSQCSFLYAHHFTISTTLIQLRGIDELRMYKNF